MPEPPTHHSRTLSVWRGLFLTTLAVLGGYTGYQIASPVVRAVTQGDGNTVAAYREVLSTPSGVATAHIAFALLGILVALFIASAAFHRLVLTGERLKAMEATEKIATFAGVVLGLLLTFMLSPILLSIRPIGIVVTLLVGITFVYLGVVALVSMKDEIRLPLQNGKASAEEDAAPANPPKILDTNVIIDGRIADIARAGFLDGPLYVPRFVLDELQHIADSADGLKRARGRRGLDILNEMRAEKKNTIRIHDTPAPRHYEEVDARLVKLAKELNGAIITNDFNLNKVAELQGVRVLNINELANAVKPVVLPGEEMTVQIVKEGKEINQGLAYLDDGTMIVVEGGRRHIGETLDVVTSSVLQTAAGKMIFASLRADHDEEEDGDRSLRSYPRGGPRRKV